MLAPFLQEPLNRLSFALRDRVLGRMRLRPGLPDPDRFRALCPGETEFYRLLLTRALALAPDATDTGSGAGTAAAADVAAAWDIGCRNWSYAAAVAEAFPRARLTGVELDGGLRYRDLYRRRDVAESFATELRARGRAVRCLFGDFRAHPVDVAPEGRSAFCFFFPFVSESPCLSWGLPREYADFGSLLDHALRAGEGTLLISAHQGEWEAELARSAYVSRGRSFRETLVRAREFQGLWPGSHDVFLVTSSARSGTRSSGRC